MSHPTNNNPFSAESIESGSVSSASSGNIPSLAHAAEIYADPSASNEDKIMAGELLARENGGILPNEAELTEMALTGGVAANDASISANPFEDAGQQMANKMDKESHTTNMTDADRAAVQADLRDATLNPSVDINTVKENATRAGMSQQAIEQATQHAATQTASAEAVLAQRPNEDLAATQERLDKEKSEKAQDGKEEGMGVLASMFGLVGGAAAMTYAVKENEHNFPVTGRGANGTQNVLEMESGLSNSALMASQAASMAQTMPAKSASMQQGMNG